MSERKKLIASLLMVVVGMAMFAIAAGAQTTNEAVCKLYRTGTQRHSGSGTFVAVSDDLQSALVISCYHVCGGKASMDCYFKNVPGLESQSFNGRVVKLNANRDLAAMLIPNPGFPPAAIGDFQQHDGIYAACGYGGGKYSAALGPAYRLSSGFMFTRTGIWPGHSGGGLFDPYGRWCGVTNWNNGSRGPNPNGFTMSSAGQPLEQFVTEAFYECGPFRKLLGNRGGGGGGGGSGDCPDGNCPNPSVPGAGYGLAPGYTPLTPLASQPQSQQQIVTPPAVIAPPATVQAVPLAVVPPTTQPAPVPDEPKPEQPSLDPITALAQQLEAVYRNEREQAAATAAMAAYRAAMSGEATTPAVQRLPKQADAEAKDPSSLVADLPVVTMQVEYREPDGRVRVESAKIDFATYVRQTFGLVSEEK